MKKLLLAATFVMLMSAAAYAEFNLKASFDFAGDYSVKGLGRNTTYDVDPSVTLTGEYLKRVVGNYLALGGGLELMAPKYYKYKSQKADDPFWLLPVYLSAQTNPVEQVPELFFKLNLGYTFISYHKAINDMVNNYNSNSYDGGLYYAVSAGWEFNCGLLLDITYASYSGSLTYKYWLISTKVDFTYTRFGVGLGYKFCAPKR